jgi:transposase-like protein
MEQVQDTPKTPQTLLEAIRYFSDLDVATQHVASVRWPDGFICPNCEGREFYYLKTRRLWKCKACKKQTSVKKGTIFEDSPLGLDKWLAALWLVVNCKNGISSYEVGRDLGVSQKGAWFMLQRLRLAMQHGTIEKYSDKFDGVVEIDETYIGGKARNMHADRRDALRKKGRIKGHAGKVGVMGFYERGGQIRLTVISGTKRPQLHQQVRRFVQPAAEVVTDALASYQGLNQHYVHNVIDHAEKYVDGLVHTNGLENFWSLLKRSLGGTYVSVQPFHLFRYLDEQAYRFNARGGTDADRFEEVLSRVSGRRLTWDEVRDKTPEQDPPTLFPVSRYPMGPF